MPIETLGARRVLTSKRLSKCLSGEKLNPIESFVI